MLQPIETPTAVLDPAVVVDELAVEEIYQRAVVAGQGAAASHAQDTVPGGVRSIATLLGRACFSFVFKERRQAHSRTM